MHLNGSISQTFVFHRMKWERKGERERERARGFEIGVCADSTVYVCIKATNGSNGKCSVLGIYRNFIYKGSVLGILYTCQMYDMLYL